jgi:hypothetical protein
LAEQGGITPNVVLAAATSCPGVQESKLGAFGIGVLAAAVFYHAWYYNLGGQVRCQVFFFWAMNDNSSLMSAMSVIRMG